MTEAVLISEIGVGWGILVILAAMPQAILGLIFLKCYGADASLASALLLAATLVISGTLLIVFSLIA